VTDTHRRRDHATYRNGSHLAVFAVRAMRSTSTTIWSAYLSPLMISATALKLPMFQQVCSSRRMHDRIALRSSWLPWFTIKCVTHALTYVQHSTTHRASVPQRMHLFQHFYRRRAAQAARQLYLVEHLPFVLVLLPLMVCNSTTFPPRPNVDVTIEH